MRNSVSTHRFARLLSCAALVAACAGLTACPDKQPDDAPAPAASSAARPPASDAAAADLGWPLAALTLPAGAVATALPEKMQLDFADDCEFSADRSLQHVTLNSGRTQYWFRAFQSELGAAELLAHFDACAAAAGLQADAAVNAANGKFGDQYFQALYASADSSIGVRIHHADYDSGVDGEGTPLILFVQTLPK